MNVVLVKPVTGIFFVVVINANFHLIISVLVQYHIVTGWIEAEILSNIFIEFVVPLLLTF